MPQALFVVIHFVKKSRKRQIDELVKNFNEKQDKADKENAAPAQVDNEGLYTYRNIDRA